MRPLGDGKRLARVAVDDAAMQPALEDLVRIELFSIAGARPADLLEVLRLASSTWSRSHRARRSVVTHRNAALGCRDAPRSSSQPPARARNRPVNREGDSEERGGPHET